jgi:hypothetical protein
MSSSPAKVCYSPSHQLPDDLPSTADGIMISEETKIFVFSLTLYKVVTGEEPYSGKDDSDIESLYRCSMFPDATGLGLLCLVII